MVIPTGTEVQINLKSLDVLHGFYVPEFNFSRYANPGLHHELRLQCPAHRGLPRPVHPALRSLSLAHVLQREGRDARAQFASWLHTEQAEVKAHPVSRNRSCPAV